MTTVKFEILRDKMISTGLTKTSLYPVDESNINDLEAACKKYREETRLPESLAECRNKLNQISQEKSWYIDGYGDVDWTTPPAAGLSFPARWQAEKLHALACMEQVWICLHEGDFSWLKEAKSHCHLIINDYGPACSAPDTLMYTPFPFRYYTLVEQARQILTDDLIKVAFSTK